MLQIAVLEFQQSLLEERGADWPARGSEKKKERTEQQLDNDTKEGLEEAACLQKRQAALLVAA